MTDSIWQFVRYLLVGFGMFLVGYGLLAKEDVVPLVDNIMQLGGATVTVVTILWGLYVRFGTKAVSVVIAARKNIPTVSVATGKVEPPAQFQG